MLHYSLFHNPHAHACISAATFSIVQLKTATIAADAVRNIDGCVLEEVNRAILGIRVLLGPKMFFETQFELE